MGRRERRGAKALDQAFQRKLELVRLVQGDLEHAGNDLHAAGNALRRSVDERQPIRAKPAVMRDLGDQGGGRRAAAFDDERGRRRAIPVGKLFEQGFAPRQRSGRA